MNPHLPTLPEVKQQARRIRQELARRGAEISHGNALEIIARQLGYRDWNTLHAAIGNDPPARWLPGGRVSGVYLSQPFEATIIAVTRLRPGWFRMVLDLDEAVDVVRFDSFSNFRKRISAVIGPEGKSRERTSDGKPHMHLFRDMCITGTGGDKRL